MNVKILINKPSSTLAGGVANHYAGLKPYWTVNVKYNVVGKRRRCMGSGVYFLPFDVVKFIFLMIFLRPDIVVLNPSIAKNALKRDYIFLKLSCLLKKNVIVFFHGFNLENYRNLSKRNFVEKINKASGVIVLAQKFKTLLQEDGIIVPIALGTTKVDDRMIDNFNIAKRNGNIKKILFLARIEKEKGIFEAIDTFSVLKKKYPNLCLTVVGSGSLLNEAKHYVNENKIIDVEFKGALSGRDLVDAFEEADCYLFPSYGEGMPTSVLEAMAFGLPVFTRNVGGLVDFFENDKMGFITDSLDPNVFAEAIEGFIENREKTRNVSVYNHYYAKEHFLASQVAVNTQNAIQKMLDISEK